LLDEAASLGATIKKPAAEISEGEPADKRDQKLNAFAGRHIVKYA
jgi:hypothetical protein